MSSTPAAETARALYSGSSSRTVSARASARRRIVPAASSSALKNGS